jgi:hypothetical protein
MSGIEPIFKKYALTRTAGAAFRRTPYKSMSFKKPKNTSNPVILVLISTLLIVETFIYFKVIVLNTWLTYKGK